MRHPPPDIPRIQQDIPRATSVQQRPVRAVSVRPWSPAQFVGIAFGAALVIVGIAVLARTGFPTEHLDRPQHDVLGFRSSPLLGATEIAFGALLIVSGIVAGTTRWFMALIGVGATGFGLILLMDRAPDRIHRWLGVGDRFGWTMVIVGVVVLLAAVVSPRRGR